MTNRLGEGKAKKLKKSNSITCLPNVLRVIVLWLKLREKQRKQIMASSIMHLQLLLFVSKMSYLLAACVQERVCLKNISR